VKSAGCKPGNWSDLGWKQRDIAEALGVTEGAVSQWFKKAREQGVEALKHKPPPGSQPKLSKEQQAQLPALLAKGAEAFGFRGQVWTTERVAQMIQQEFGVSYHPAHCSRLLRNLNYSQQKPIEKATQRDENAIRMWKEDRFDELKKRAEAQGQTMVFVDESAFYLLPMAVRTYAPCGQTPILQVPLSRFPPFGHRRHYPKGEDLHANARPLVQGARCRPLPPAPLTRDCGQDPGDLGWGLYSSL